MNRKTNEQLLDVIGNIDERYINEYMDAQIQNPGKARIRFGFALAAAMTILAGTVSLAAAIPAIGHFLTNSTNEKYAVMQNFDEIEARYGVPIGDTQECNGVTGTLNSAIVEDHYILLSYTFNWGGLEEAKDGSFHTYFLPWFFSITEGDKVICHSEYTQNLHTQLYYGDADKDFTEITSIYCIDLKDLEGKELVGRELTVRLRYSSGDKGFSSTFTPKSCFPDNNWNIGKTYEFEGHKIKLDKVQESALYVTLFIDCADIGHNGDAYRFVLSDELGNDYTAYPYDNNNIEGYWFTKPKTMGTQLTLKVIRSNLKSDPYGEIIDDSYEVIYEIPIELKTSFWDALLGN